MFLFFTFPMAPVSWFMVERAFSFRVISSCAELRVMSYIRYIETIAKNRKHGTIKPSFTLY